MATTADKKTKKEDEERGRRWRDHDAVLAKEKNAAQMLQCSPILGITQ